MKIEIDIIEKGSDMLCVAYMSDSEKLIKEIKNRVGKKGLKSAHDNENLRLKSLKQYVLDRIIIDDDFLRRW